MHLKPSLLHCPAYIGFCGGAGYGQGTGAYIGQGTLNTLNRRFPVWAVTPASETKKSLIPNIVEIRNVRQRLPFPPAACNTAQFLSLTVC